VLDGFYVWVNPGKKGWQAKRQRLGKDHLEDFYKRMRDKYPDKLLVAGAWPGFDDSKASWGLNRHMDTRCGKTSGGNAADRSARKFWPQSKTVSAHSNLE
jgi:hypothetical protein